MEKLTIKERLYDIRARIGAYICRELEKMDDLLDIDFGDGDNI